MSWHCCFILKLLVQTEHAVRRQLPSKMRPRSPFMELYDVLTTQHGIKPFWVTQDSLLLCFAFLGPTYQAGREKSSVFTTFEVVKPPLFDMSLFQLPSLSVAGSSIILLSLL